ncbi:MAG: SlyX family protein [Chloroflexi bacterium]|nr:MAG: SlyX family protein [Chloroflexota bacterium]
MPAAGTRRRRLGGHELVEQLNAAVAALIKENRKLKRQVEKLTARVPARATGTVDRSLRTIQRRVQKALTTATKRRRRRSVVGAAKKKITRRA